MPIQRRLAPLPAESIHAILDASYRDNLVGACTLSFPLFFFCKKKARRTKSWVKERTPAGSYNGRCRHTGKEPMGVLSEIEQSKRRIAFSVLSQNIPVEGYKHGKSQNKTDKQPCNSDEIAGV